MTVGLLDQTTDAAFRVWGLEFNGGLTAVGLTQTSDTGQINWSTVTRAVSGAVAGYEIWQFTDSLQSTVPVVFKIEYGSNSSANSVPQIWITVGTGSNGSGTITNILTARVQCNVSGATVVGTSTNFVSKFVFNPTYGFFGVVFKEKSLTSTGVTAVFDVRICRTVDQSTGLPTNIGFNLFMRNGNANSAAPTSMSATFANGFTSTGITNNYYVIPGGPTNTLLNGTPGSAQVFRPKFIYPQELSVSQWGICVATELPAGTQFPSRLIGSTTLNYISNYSGGYVMHADAATGTINDFMLWQ